MVVSNVPLIEVVKLLVRNDPTVVLAAFVGEAMWWCSLVVLILSVMVTRVVFSVARLVSRPVMLCGRLSPMLVLATVLTSRKKHVGLSLDMVAMVLTRVLSLIYIITFMVSSSRLVRRCRLVAMLVAVNRLSIFPFSRVGAPGT